MSRPEPTVTARGLLLASHPAPALTVTVLVTLLVLAVGAAPQVAAGTALAVLAGQLSVGWSNDAADARADLAAARCAKPVVRGMVDAATLWVAAGVALALAVLASLALMGAVSGGLHVLAVLAAWVYNVWAKDTPLSAVPYALAFAVLPLVVAGLAQPPIDTEAWWALVCASVGVAAHLANTAPDVDSDRMVGRGGLAVVLGSGPARAVAVALVAVAAAVVLASVPDPGPALVGWTLACVVLIALLAAAQRGRLLFPGVMAVVAISAGALLVST